MKKCFVIGLIMALIPQVGAIAAQKTVDVLIAEKQAKMKKLEKCKGTTKGLKIAGISTLGITAVGVGANIAEAVVLNDYKDKVSKEKKELAKQQELQKFLKDGANEKALAAAATAAEERSIKQFCDSLGINVAPWGHECFNVISDEVQFADVANKLNAFNSNCNMLTFHAIGQDIERAVGKYPIATALCGNNIVVNFQFTNLKCPDGQEFGFDSNKCVDKAASEPKAEAEEKAEENSNQNGEANTENDNEDSNTTGTNDNEENDQDAKNDNEDNNNGVKNNENAGAESPKPIDNNNESTDCVFGYKYNYDKKICVKDEPTPERVQPKKSKPKKQVTPAQGQATPIKPEEKPEEKTKEKPEKLTCTLRGWHGYGYCENIKTLEDCKQLGDKYIWDNKKYEDLSTNAKGFLFSDEMPYEMSGPKCFEKI